MDCLTDADKDVIQIDPVVSITIERVRSSGLIPGLRLRCVGRFVSLFGFSSRHGKLPIFV
jgi:hypothetical protein